MLEEIIEQFAVDPERTLMIGDTTHDLLMAQNAGAKGLGITHGAHPVSAPLDCAPVGMVNSIPNLANWLIKNG